MIHSVRIQHDDIACACGGKGALLKNLHAHVTNLIMSEAPRSLSKLRQSVGGSGCSP